MKETYRVLMSGVKMVSRFSQQLQVVGRHVDVIILLSLTRREKADGLYIHINCIHQSLSLSLRRLCDLARGARRTRKSSPTRY